MGPKNLLYFVSFSLQFAPPNKPWRRRDKLKNSFVFVSLYKCEWLLKNSLKKLVKYLWFWSHQKKSMPRTFLISNWRQKPPKTLMNYRMIDPKGFKSCSSNNYYYVHYYNHHREILSCFLEITTMKMNIRPVIFLPPECIIVPLMTTHKMSEIFFVEIHYKRRFL